MAKIIAPVEGFNGKVVGVTFVDGKGETKDEGQISYFVRHGYTVTGVKAVSATETDAEKEAKVKAEAEAKAAEEAKVEEAKNATPATAGAPVPALPAK